MIDPYRDNDTSAAGRRRWVRLLMIAGVILALLVLVVLLLGGLGGHGPGRHMGQPAASAAWLLPAAP